MTIHHALLPAAAALAIGAGAHAQITLTDQTAASGCAFTHMPDPDAIHASKTCAIPLPQSAWSNGIEPAAMSRFKCRSWRLIWGIHRWPARIGTLKPFLNCSNWRRSTNSLLSKEGDHECCELGRAFTTVLH